MTDAADIKGIMETDKESKRVNARSANQVPVA